MSLTVLVLIVGFGIAAVVAAVHWSGGTTTATLAGDDQARARFAEDFPDEAPSRIWLTENRETAFLDLGGGRVGIVQSFGDRFLTRIARREDLAAAGRDDPVTVELGFRDFTWRGGRFRFASADDAAALSSALGLE